MEWIKSGKIGMNGKAIKDGMILVKTNGNSEAGGMTPIGVEDGSGVKIRSGKLLKMTRGRQSGRIGALGVPIVSVTKVGETMREGAVQHRPLLLLGSHWMDPLEVRLRTQDRKMVKREVVTREKADLHFPIGNLVLAKSMCQPMMGWKA
jgi:hypothetical protein